MNIIPILTAQWIDFGLVAIVWLLVYQGISVSILGASAAVVAVPVFLHLLSWGWRLPYCTSYLSLVCVTASASSRLAIWQEREGRRGVLTLWLWLLLVRIIFKGLLFAYVLITAWLVVVIVGHTTHIIIVSRSNLWLYYSGILIA